MIKWLATAAVIIAATTSGANSCDTKTNPNNINQFGDNPGYDCELDWKGPVNLYGDVAFYVRNFCNNPLDVPQWQSMTLWIESRPGLFDDWKQRGKPSVMNGKPSFPSGETELVTGGRCEPDTQVRLAWKVVGATHTGADFGPIDRHTPDYDAPC